MRLNWQLTLNNPGNRPLLDEGIIVFDDPHVDHVEVNMSLSNPESAVGFRMHNFSGDATFSFLDTQMNSEFCKFRGSVIFWPFSIRHMQKPHFSFSVTYHNNYQQSAHNPGLACDFSGQIGEDETFYHFISDQREISTHVRLIQPTSQQQRYQIMLDEKAGILMRELASLMLM